MEDNNDGINLRFTSEALINNNEHVRGFLVQYVANMTDSEDLKGKCHRVFDPFGKK